MKILGSEVPTKLQRWCLAFILCLGIFGPMGSGTFARNHCKDRCNDRYHMRKDVCKAIPLKYERHRCEDAAKHAKDRCKRDCH